ncbi:MAG: M48 family metallopeptidase [Janthinobacterium lividum]
MAHKTENELENERLGRRRFLRSAALTAAGIAAVPLLLPSPALAGGFFSAASPDDQKKIGDQAAAQVLKQYHEVFDGRATHFNQLGQRLVHALPASDRNTWNFRFHVLDSKEVNAFALPGGNMFMFTGLYKLLATDDALAGVTGHEMTHVRLQHWAKANAKQQERDTLLALGLSFFHAGTTAQSIAGMVDSTIGLKYSRTEEDQADQGGLQNMVAAGFNPQGMIQLFQTLEKVSGNGGSVAGDFLSDHPLTSDRIKRTQQRIAALQSTSTFPPLTPLHYSQL